MDDEANPEQIEEVIEIISHCSAILAGHDRGVQGAALAELLAMWLAGQDASAETREKLLAMHLRWVRAFAATKERRHVAVS